ncbi:MAG TPA: amidohydrolase, partial [Urbifossiella sp.]|nr:amidohydrolase [Urbifossiella sp.]
MRRPVALAVLAVLASPSLAVAQKDAVVKAAAAQAAANWPTAVQIWEWAEPGYQEAKSAKALADLAEKAGFKVTRGVAGIPTAFVAEFGT